MRYSILLGASAALAASLSSTPLAVVPLATAQSELLLSEVVVTPTAGEFVEIFNPNPFPVDLSDVYLTDATFQNGGAYYYNVVTGADAGGGGFSDFHARFPDGAAIAPGEYQTVAIAGSDAFLAEYGALPDYELVDDGGAADGVPQMREALPGSIALDSGLTNSGEVVVLYYWDGESDLVTDLDYVVWGDTNEGVDKTGVAIDGPDADAATSTYAPDTPLASQDFLTPHGFGASFTRTDFSEGMESDGVLAPDVVFDDFNDGTIDGVFTFSDTGAGIGAGTTDGQDGTPNSALSVGVLPADAGSFIGFVVTGGDGVDDISNTESLSFYVRPTQFTAANEPFLLEVNLHEDANGNGTYEGDIDDEYQATYLLTPGTGYTRVEIPLSAFVDDNTVFPGADGAFDFTRLLEIVVAVGAPQGPELVFAMDDIVFEGGVLAGGNGVNGDDETSEDLSNTFAQGLTPTPNEGLPAVQEITVSFVSASGTANEADGPAPITVEVTTNDGQPLDRNVTVDVTFTGGTASADDFTDVPPTTRTLAFFTGTASGSTMDATFTLLDDAIDEGTEEATFSLSGGLVGEDPDGFGQDTFALTIIDDDGTPPSGSPVVINEVDADQPGTDNAEFIELFNPSGTVQSLDGLVLVVFNGSNGQSYGAVDLDGQSIAPNDRFVVCISSSDFDGLGICDLDASALIQNGSIQNGEDAVALYLGDATDFPDGTMATDANLLDAVVYETGSDTNTDLPTLLGTGVVYDEFGPDSGLNYSVQRFPDGTGSFVTDLATPGLQNIPVELAAPLAAREEAGRVVLTWATASETNNAYFEVLARRADAAAFTSLGQVEGAGTTSASQQYSIALDDLAPGTYRFRLRQVDLDGTAEVVSETEASVTLSVTHRVTAVWPNPAVGAAQLEVAAARAQRVSVKVYDALGRLVATALDTELDAQQSRTVALGARLAPGAYVAVVAGEQFREVRRFTVSR